MGYDVIGNMTDFDSVIVGSSPAVPATKKIVLFPKQIKHTKKISIVF